MILLVSVGFSNTWAVRLRVGKLPELGSSCRGCGKSAKTLTKTINFQWFKPSSNFCSKAFTSSQSNPKQTRQVLNDLAVEAEGAAQMKTRDGDEVGTMRKGSFFGEAMRSERVWVSFFF